MHGAGNDFIIIDDRSLLFNTSNRSLIKKICNRSDGLGSDGLILLQKSDLADIRMRFFNCDGSEASMCGNGARCISIFAQNLKIVNSKIRIETNIGCFNATISGNEVCLELFKWNNECINGFNFKGREYDILNTGVPHVVTWLDNLEEFNSIDINKLGSSIRTNEFFAPDGTNVNIAWINNLGVIFLRTYERGVESETLSCGTGSLAAARVAVLKGLASFPVKVKCKSGDILVVDNNNGYAILTGSAIQMDGGVLDYGNWL